MNTKQAITFDPNSLGQKDSNIFGLPFSPEQAQMVLIPVPWEVTVSYRAGTAGGPAAIMDASKQVDLYEPLLEDAWKIGLSMLDLPEHLLLMNSLARSKAEAYILLLENGESPETSQTLKTLLNEINDACVSMNTWVKEEAQKLYKQGKFAAVVGGDHSTPLGLIQAVAEKFGDFGILHFDAHADLRDAYEGFTYSHASIMFNALKVPALKKLVQVGIRDYCQDEHDLITGSHGRIITHFDRDLKARLYSGESWKEICQMVVHQLPEQVYVSFDIDGLDPKLCPNTGTPVPGGLELEQALFMVQMLVESGKKIIAFDVNEVAPGQDDEWDANVGARLLYRLANLAAISQGLQPIV
ncbi:MAG TPA: agmatinase family protein [Candidatus Obscuribacter sp.]|nr:agmatinase family protein [Candidatus Obscuribacter sp.]MBK9277834.1 agmatinase family protein [Candidatus Obscuribacter sp.]HNG19288.1 agmatinase family protein [Candidatus Obscuribacter sp.]HNH72205.1 agmatinase family protein [Candidatus Obscuribacter sp.]